MTKDLNTQGRDAGKHMKRLSQYMHRLASVYLTTLPGGYTHKKVEILQSFYLLTNRFLQDLGVDYWLAYGTLLGYHRVGGILPHDIDIDYVMGEEAFDVVWNNRHRLPKGITIYDTSNKHKGPKLYLSYKGFDCDIYFYRKSKDYLEPFLVSDLPGDTAPIPLALIYPLQAETFLGAPTKIPHQTKPYLELCYGYIGADARLDPLTKYWVKRTAYNK